MFTSKYCSLLYLSLFFCSIVQALDVPVAVQGVTTINVHQARSLYESGAVFIDVRDREDWVIGHIEGAIHLDFQKDFEKLYDARSTHGNTPIVFYCNSPSCVRSAYASAISTMWGFNEVYYFKSGYFAWMLYDYPVVMNLTASLDQGSL